MEYRTLGNTGLLVSRLCLGTMTFGSGDGMFKSIGRVDQQGVEEGTACGGRSDRSRKQTRTCLSKEQ